MEVGSLLAEYKGPPVSQPAWIPTRRGGGYHQPACVEADVGPLGVIFIHSKSENKNPSPVWRRQPSL